MCNRLVAHRLPRLFVRRSYIYDENLGLERSTWISAERERIRQAITDPEQAENWFSLGTRWGGTDPEIGERRFPSIDTVLILW